MTGYYLYLVRIWSILFWDSENAFFFACEMQTIIMRITHRWCRSCGYRTYNETKHEPRHEKTYLRGFQPSPTKTGLYNH